MLSKLSFLLGFITIVLFASCGSINSTNIPQNYFLPQEGNALKVKEKNDLSVSGGYSFFTRTTFDNPFFTPGAGPVVFPSPGLNSSNPNYESKTRRGSFQAAYSPFKHLGLFGHHSFSKSSDADNTFHKSHLTGGGIGTYYYHNGFQRPPKRLKPGQEPKPTNVLFDLYAGYSLGAINNRYVFTTGNTSMNFQKYYLQGGAHWIGRQVSLSFTLKAGKVNYYNGIINGKTHLDSDGPVFSILEINNLLFVEPSFKVDVTFRGIGVFGQMTFASIPDFNFTGIDNPIAHLGLVFDIHALRKVNK